MRQPASRDLFAYWNDLRGDRQAPERGEIDPRAIHTILPHLFLLGQDAAGRYPFRLAGMAVCALFGRELRDTPFVALWPDNAKPAVAALLRGIVEDNIGAVETVTGRNEAGQILELELLLLPLAGRSDECARIIGALSAPLAPYWIGIRPLVTLQPGHPRFVGPAVDRAAQRLIAGHRNPLQGPGFVVYPADPRRALPGNVSGLTER